MERRFIILLIAALLLPAACTRAAEQARHDTSAHDKQAFDEIARGSYLATVGDCAACHSDPKSGNPYAGGKAIDTPFGKLLGPNLTPDRDTGIGAWSDDDFVAALLRGEGHGGAHLYPAMPYTYFTKMSRKDAVAIRAYLNTLEPVRNEVKSNQLPFPFDIRAGMAGWNVLFFTAGVFKPDASKSDAWNRGAYLVEGPAHCGMCHTAKNLFGADRASHALQGGVLQNWFAPDLTDNSQTGVGDWSADDLATYLKTGHNRMAAATGPMAEVVADSTSKLSDTDLEAIAAYLKDQKESSPANAETMAQNDPAMAAGGAIYKDNCAACHAGGGTGVPHLFPPLKQSAAVQSDDPTDLIQAVLHGAQNVATDDAPTGPSMPALGWKLSDQEVADTLDYIRNSWGNHGASVSPKQVERLR